MAIGAVGVRAALLIGVATLTAGTARARTLHLIAVTDRGYTLVDSDTIKHEGDFAEGWVSLFMAHKFAETAYVVKSRMRFDCTGARWQTLEEVSYNRSLVEVARTAPAAPGWSDVLPETITVREIMAICFDDYRGGGAKPLPSSATDKYLLDLMDKVSR